MIPGYVREAAPGEFADRVVPEGFRLVVVDALRRNDVDRLWGAWQLASPGRRCQYTVGPGHKRCLKPAVVHLQRGHNRATWWGYCGDHLYGRIWDADHQQLLTAVLVPKGEQP